MRHHHLVSSTTTIIVTVTFLLTLIVTAAAAATNHYHHHQDNNQDIISINCGSITPSPPAPSGKHWLADANPSFLTLKGSSTTRSSSAAAAHAKLIPSVDQFPYTSARISRSKFSYSFHLSPGQKFIRLHFNPDSYDDFQKFDDLFTVEAGRFTLLSNFSASITADALSAVTLVKEFCVTVLENLLLDVVFTPASSSSSSYAFVNGIEIISLPAGLYYCLGGDVGVRLVGQRSVVYVDNATALEMIHRLSVKRDSVLPVDDFPGVFGMWKSKGLVNGREKDVDSGVSWKVPVDVGFRYLVRAHFCELGLKLNHSNFVLFIDHMVVNARADVVEERDVNGILWYRNHMVEVKGRKEEGKRDILIYLHSEDGYADGHGVLEGFEIFKLSNHDNSLASLNPSPLAKDSPLHPIRSVLLVLGQRNAFITVVIAAICLVNIVVYMLRQHWEGNVTEEENEPSNRAKSLCRLFSFSEIQSATDDFFDAFIIGRGGFGKVYKGIVDKGQEIVAIKRLKANSKQGKREFWTEVEMLSELRHMNLVSLIGYCNEHREMILVYEYMSCGTLADHLYKLAEKGNNSISLSWEQRLKICIGAARGLDYLHTGHGIIHRDVKASNILLDENFVAKVSDFGLAKIENADSTNLKGTFGYIDPDYFRTRKLTTKSDTYSFGVVLLEVLCGRRAVDPSLDEDKRSLTMWFRDNISKGDTDEIVAPSLREEISPDSLKTFLGVAEKCLHDEPKKRPTIAHVVINLEFALEQQENAKALVPSEKTSIADFFPHSNKIQQEHTKIMIPNETTNILDVLPCRDKTQEDNTRSLSPNEITGDIDVLPFTGRTILPVCGSQPKTVPSSLQNVTSILKVQTTSRMINTEPPYGKKDGRKSPFHKLSRLLPLNALWNSRKLSKRKNLVDISLSAPVAQKSSNKAFSRDDAVSGKLKSMVVEPSEDLPPTLLPSPDIRIFTFSELKAATKNFRNDTILGEGGFGRVYKGWLDDKSITRMGCRTIIAVKKLNPESLQGFKEWLSEVNFLGRLSHPNLVKLFGYCSENKEMLLVYEFMQKGSFDNHLFRRGSVRQPLAWDLRLKILIGAARGLAFLHGLDVKIIYRDFKTSNILLDESYNAKLSDFGLAKSGPRDDFSHVSTRVMGTYGYAAPEYVATGHLTDKSDVYSFGVVLVEILTGLWSLDLNRPSGQQNLVDWMKPRLQKLSKLKMAMDPNMEKGYPIRSALRVAQLALNCLGGDPKRRPTMQEVVETLEKIDLDTEKPRQPRVRFTEQLAK